jgi:hypothetical protein
MSQATAPREVEGIAERRAQKELTERVAVRLTERGKSDNLKWSTWRWRLGMRGGS